MERALQAFLLPAYIGSTPFPDEKKITPQRTMNYFKGFGEIRK